MIISALAPLAGTAPSNFDATGPVATSEQRNGSQFQSPRKLSDIELAAHADLQARDEARATATRAISTIALLADIRDAIPVSPKQTQPSPRDFVLYGDSGLLIQSNNAAATIGRFLLPVVYPTLVTPAVPPVAAIAPLVRPALRGSGIDESVS